MHMSCKSREKYLNESIDPIFEMPQSFFCIRAESCAFLTSLMPQLLDSHWPNRHFKIAKFIAHKINKEMGTNFSDQYLHSYSVTKKSSNIRAEAIFPC